MPDINYPQRWLKEHKAIPTERGWSRPTTGELLKCQKGIELNLVEDFDVNISGWTILKGAKKEMTVNVIPVDAVLDDLVITSTPGAEITFENGKWFISGVSVGTATITAKSESNKITKTYTIEITPILVSGINFTITPASVLIGDVNEVTVSVTPSDATDKTYTMTASENIELTNLGNNKYSYKALSTGPAELKATANDASGIVKTVSIQVNPVLVSDITFMSNNSGSLVVGETHTLTVFIAPENATDKTYTMTTTDNIELIPTGNNSYTYKASISTPNTGSITATANDASDISRTANFTITDPIVLVESIDFNLPTESDIAETYNLSELITINPTNATDKTYTTSIVSGPGVIDESNVLSFTAAGTVQVKVKANDSSSIEVIKDIVITETA